MSEGQLPAYVDIRRAFLQDELVSGFVSLERLPRFREILASEEASIETELRFSLNREGERQISGKLSMQGEVPCQRCLEPVAVQIQDTIRLVLVDSESAAANLKPDWDPWLSGDYKLQLAEIVEEQLLLSLPIVNYHSDEECIERLDYQQQIDEARTAKSAEQIEEAKENPFAVLKVLKEDKS